MLTKKEWITYVIGPLLLVILFDQISKIIAVNYVQDTKLGILRFVLFQNKGFMLGTFSSLAKLHTVVIPATLASLLLFVFAVLQYLIPIKFLFMRFGASVFMGGVLSNIIDKIQYGAVIDFISINFGTFRSGIFNIADALQWIGLGIFFVIYIRHGHILFRPDERRGKKWIDPKFQGRYCVILSSTGLSFTLTAGILCYTFMQFAISDVTGLSNEYANQMTNSFLQVYLLAALAFQLMLLAVGIHLSHRIVGPIRGFQNFLENAIQGKAHRLHLRQHDELKQLQEIADLFYENFIVSKNIQPAPLEPGQSLPYFIAKTRDAKTFMSETLVGRSCWLIFYRYATCPLCADHLHGIVPLINQAKKNRVIVAIVYESTPEQFHNSASGRTSEFLKSLDIEMVADTNRTLYKAFRTQKSLIPIFRPGTYIARYKAKENGFMQTDIDGELGQLPAHFFIDRQAVLVKCHYSKTFIDHPTEHEILSFIKMHGDNHINT